MTGHTRTRVEWQPGDAALEALEISRRLFPHLSRQSLIDRLVITGLAALKHTPWRPPELWGKHRDRWKLPAELRADIGADAK